MGGFVRRLVFDDSVLSTDFELRGRLFQLEIYPRGMQKLRGLSTQNQGYMASGAYPVERCIIFLYAKQPGPYFYTLDFNGERFTDFAYDYPGPLHGRGRSLDVSSYPLSRRPMNASFDGLHLQLAIRA